MDSKGNNWNNNTILNKDIKTHLSSTDPHATVVKSQFP